MGSGYVENSSSLPNFGTLLCVLEFFPGPVDTRISFCPYFNPKCLGGAVASFSFIQI